MNINRVVLAGRLGADPVVRETQSGGKMAYFSIATHRRKLLRRGAQGEASEYVDHTEWHRIVSWGKVAERCSNYLKKGNAVLIEGNLRINQVIPEDTTQRPNRYVEVEADRVHFIGTSPKRAVTAQALVEEADSENSSENITETDESVAEEVLS